MRRRSGAGGEKPRRHKTATLKRRNAPKVARRRSSSAVSQDTKIALLARERDEALEQLSAASEVLNVISSSPGELKPVFDTILENATRICEAKFGILCSYDGNLFKYAAVWERAASFSRIHPATRIVCAESRDAAGSNSEDKTYHPPRRRLSR